MKNQNIYFFVGVIILLSIAAKKDDAKNSEIQNQTTFSKHVNSPNMKLGAFSMSLNVKDLAVSKLFYENLGFTVLAGDMKMNYLIMKNENALIGLFHGMFQNNIITFNPGWNESGKNIDSFDDVREIERMLKEKGVKLDTQIPANTSGPASIVLKDPDGNLIFIDQHR